MRVGRGVLSSLFRCCWTISAGALSTKPLLASLASIDLICLVRLSRSFSRRLRSAPTSMKRLTSTCTSIGPVWPASVMLIGTPVGSAVGPNSAARCTRHLGEVRLHRFEQFGRGFVAADREAEFLLERNVLPLPRFANGAEHGLEIGELLFDAGDPGGMCRP